MHHQNAVESLIAVCVLFDDAPHQGIYRTKERCWMHQFTRLLWRSKSLENYIEAPNIPETRSRCCVSLHLNNMPQVWKNLGVWCVVVLFGCSVRTCVCLRCGGASREIRRWSLGRKLRRARIGYPHHVVRINLLPFPYKRKPQIYSRCVCVSPPRASDSHTHHQNPRDSRYNHNAALAIIARTARPTNKVVLFSVCQNCL